MFDNKLFDTKRQARRLRNEAWDLYARLGMMPANEKAKHMLERAYRRWLRRRYACERAQYPTYQTVRPAPKEQDGRPQ